MVLNQELYISLLEQAKSNPRLRQAMDLRTTSEDQSQRMLNALIPGTIVPMHRHPASAESAIVLFGELYEVLYDNKGCEIERIHLREGEGVQIPKGQFHTINVIKNTILLEVKDGAYTPISREDVIE